MTVLRTAARVKVTGLVQGVGFRPYVYRLATELGLDGVVGNDAASVFVELEGPADGIERFVARLTPEAPPLAAIDSVEVHFTEAKPGGGEGFAIVESRPAAGAVTVVSPDMAVCDACLQEMWDPTNRRFLHPFVTCTNCGPRFTITRRLPYDRAGTTMARFALCPACRAEYEDPTDRRYHAQPIGCHDCGPTLTFRLGGGPPMQGPGAVDAARGALRRGAILAVKGLGGYHLVCDATSEPAVAELRRRKGRADKPFAVMAADLTSALALARLGVDERSLLVSPARPIVLAPARPDRRLSPSVAPGNPLVGIMLPYTPVQHLLFNRPGPDGPHRSLGPLVVTSSNPSGEPISYHDQDLAERVNPLVDGVLTHDRPIHVPCDDSVVRVAGAHTLPVRRSRGYAPIPLSVPPVDGDVLAVGAELKNAFCVASGRRAWMSQHIGDMGNIETLDAFETSFQQFCHLYRLEPAVVAIDTHPGYLSSRWARARYPNAIVEVQHHHAHIASVMAEHRLHPDHPVIGIAFDGTGYGDDGTIWGGEILEATAGGYHRAGHLAPVGLPGGDAAVEHPWRIALSHLQAAGMAWEDDLPPVRHATALERHAVAYQLSSGLGCAATTSMGRLFDAVSSLLGLRHHVTYEAQAAIELEHAAAAHLTSGSTPAPPLRFEPAEDGVFDAAPVIAGLVEGLRAGVPVGAAAASFHLAVAEVSHHAACAARDRTGCSTVVLAGGVWQNALLVTLTRRRLSAAGFAVYTNRLVPTNDGGLALGQMLVAARRVAYTREA